MKALLISENSDDWDTLKGIILSKFPNLELIIADGPEEAMEQAGSNGPYGIYLLDIDMKEIDANALGLNLIEFTGPRPTIFIGTEQVFKDVVSQELYNSNDFNKAIYRPVARESFHTELVDYIRNALTWVKKEEFAENVIEIDPSEYIKMKLRSFYLYDVFSYDIYMAVTDTCYIKIISADRPYSNSTLSHYAKKNVRHLYIKKDDHLKFLDSQGKKCFRALHDVKLDHKDIYLVFLRSISIFHEYLNSIGLTPSAQKLVDKTIEVIIAHSEKERELSNILKKYPIYYQGISSKSLLTAFISIALSNKSGWESITTKKKLVVSSILQDFNLEDDILSKVSFASSNILKQYSDETESIFLEHPNKCGEFSKQFSTYPDIAHIIENHHELPNRKGFPNKPSTSKLTQINAVFNISQHIAAKIDGQEIKNQLLSKTLKSMSKDFGVGSFKETLKLAQKILKLK